MRFSKHTHAIPSSCVPLYKFLGMCHKQLIKLKLFDLNEKLGSSKND